MSFPYNEENVRFGHTDETTAIVVDDYPYGRRVRTQIRYWLETTKHGDRFVSQTLNPKTDRWNKPKKSTYAEVGVIYIEDGTGYVRWAGLHHYASPEAVEHFVSVCEQNLSDAQKAKVAEIIAVARVMSKVEWKIEVNPQRTAEEQAAHDAEQAEISGRIGRAVAVETARVMGDLA